MRKNQIQKSLSVSASNLIKKVAIFSANSASPFTVYQPVEPKEIFKFKKNRA